jgi:glycolate oxidase FAD binding subunit
VETIQQELAPFGPRNLELIDGAAAGPIWTALTEFQVCPDAPLTFQANLLPSKTIEFLERATELGVSAQAHAGNGSVIGHLPDEAAAFPRAAEMLTALRQLGSQGGGNVVVFDCPAAWKAELPLFGAPESAWSLMQRVKHTLDPHDLLNPGRFLAVGNQRSAISIKS